MQRDTYVIEFMVGEQDRVASLSLRIHGGDEAMDVAHVLCEQTGWRAYDTCLGDFIDFAAKPAAGLRAWREYRDRVIPPPIDESG